MRKRLVLTENSRINPPPPLLFIFFWLDRPTPDQITTTETVVVSLIFCFKNLEVIRNTCWKIVSKADTARLFGIKNLFRYAIL
jgi:hypothetical protein